MAEPRPKQKHGVDDLIATIDAYLAEQISYRYDRAMSTDSRGTMFVDFDDAGEMVVSYRIPHRKPSPLIATIDGMQVRYSRAKDGVYVAGQDCETGFKYDYDGCVMHVHKKASTRSSLLSDYYSIDAEKYTATTKLRPVSAVDVESPALPRERKKRHKVIHFVDKVLGKLDGMGLMGSFGRWAGRRKKRREYGLQSDRPPSWVAAGYMT
ncbi:hypothetical protein N0V90_004407 [Kalmusia sp. IMI 367209]|nr:hypothetical protein N0V90_004407 [Kalmusia sp. IMI 367209]